MRVDRDFKLDFDDVLIRPKRSTLSSRRLVDLNRKFEFRHSNETWEGIPVIAANMDTTGTFEIAESLKKEKMLTAIHKFYSLDQWAKAINSSQIDLEHCAVTFGVEEAENAEEFFDYLEKNNLNKPKFICLDVANGYTELFLDLVKKIRSKFDNPLIAGNVVTGEMTEALILAGADIVKIGIGPGSVCTTRTVTGVGYPQLSAIIECADAAHGLRGHVISDGGCSKPGDVAKAFGAGADFVMLGGMFAGHEESGGELIEKDGKKYKQFYGMSSDTAMERYYGDIKNYRASEGETIALEYKGPIDKTIQQILGGLRSAATYVGAKDIKNLPKCTTFILKYK
ncbi:MAG: GMP reductase [Chloroflexota bacterium]|nr:GMP reductase [Chloroflexota bacterium]|tara:strand:+ start:5397 stop:6416 length:1020 start_codon:yes stop_codon:yes gene_type:complete